MISSITRKTVTSTSRNADRNRRVQGHLLRSLGSQKSYSTPTRWSPFYNDRGSNGLALQRILERAAATCNSTDDDVRGVGPSTGTRLSDFDRKIDFKRYFYSASNSLHELPRANLLVSDPLVFLGALPRSHTASKYNVCRMGSSSNVVEGISRPGSLANVTLTDRRSFSTENSPGSQYKTSVKIPEPKSAPNNPLFSSIHPKAIAKKAFKTTWAITKAVLLFLIKFPGDVFFYLTHPKERKDKIQEIKGHASKEFDHYWTGSKLLMADVRTARDLIIRTLTGSTLTRRERKQLLRTVTDLFRLVPFSMFLIIPLAEFALPFALRLFPNMLPSTFQDSLKAEESMKRELQSRIAMAHFFQETLEELAKEQKRIAAKRNVESPDNEIANKQEQSAASMLEFLERARLGEMIPPGIIIQYAKYFQDDLTLDNMPRMQLVNMCRYMQLPPYGADSFLRLQLRHRIRQLKEDDQRIIWEGINSLTKMELREACQERGMRSTGLSKEAYKRSLQQWLDLSVHQNVPISLLIMSRTFFLQEEVIQPAPGGHTAKSVANLADAISGMDKDVLNEVILEVATQEEKKSNPDIRKIKLEVVTQQNERIREEREAVEKKKKASERSEEPPEEKPLAAIELELSPEQAERLARVVDAQKDRMDGLMLKTKEVHSSGSSTKKDDGSSQSEDDKYDLSAAEIDAISQLLSADPVSKERQELARIKSALSEKEKVEMVEEVEADAGGNAPSATSTGEESDAGKEASSAAVDEDDYAAKKIQTMEKQANKEAEEATVFSTEMEPNGSVEKDVDKNHSDKYEDQNEVEEDPIVSRLKRRVESMVDRIELQLSDVEREIGDKLHMLDKDSDGVLSREEMAEVLHEVLKREITFDEAMEIASTMDENKDGVFTVQELMTWIETNKLYRLQSEGRDADMERIIESRSSEASKEESSTKEESSSPSSTKSAEN